MLTEAEWVPDEQAETRVLTAECAAWLEEGGTTLADVPDNYLNCAQRLNSVHLTAAYRLFP